LAPYIGVLRDARGRRPMMSPTNADVANEGWRERAHAFDLRHLPDAFYDDPYPWYRALREHDPVHALPGGGVFLSRYDDCVAVYRDAAAFSSDKKVEFRPKYGESPLYRHHTTSLVFSDPPYHTLVRRLIAGALTQRAIAAMEPALVALVDDLLARLEGKGRVDLVEDYAAAIPVEVIGNLLAVPHADRGPLRGWSLAILGALEPAPTAEQLDSGNCAVEEFLAYLTGLVADRRRHPGDPERDVLTRLVQGEPDGERLAEAELLHNCIFILNAGHETTTNLIGNGLATLHDWPGERARLLSEPTLLRGGVEEMLRLESSNQLGSRMTTREVEIGGVRWPPGTSVTIGIGAANRDPSQFAEPERFDVARQPNRHLAFALGIHQCAGLSLARLEGRIAIGRFLARFPRYALDGRPVRRRRARFHGFLSMPCVLAP
jgi:hypothetical protein